MCKVIQWNNLKLVVMFVDVSIQQRIFVEQKAVILSSLAFCQLFLTILKFTLMERFTQQLICACISDPQVHFCLKISILEGSLLVIEEI